MSLYYYTDELGEVQGPYQWEHIEAWIQEGSIPSSTYIQDDQQSMEWTLYADLVTPAAPEPIIPSGIVPLPEYAEEPAKTWVHSVWHYLDDNSTVQGPYSTATIGDWIGMGALGSDRYCSIDGGEWVLLETTEPYQTLWAPSKNVEVMETSSAPDRKIRRQSMTLIAAQRCHARRESNMADSNFQNLKQTASAPSISSKQTSNLATKLSSQKSLLRKTTGPSTNKSTSNTKRPETLNSAQSALIKGMEVRRTILTRGKKRRSTMVNTNLTAFKMADGSVVPEGVARGPRVHRRRVSDFSESDDDDDWLSD